MQRLDVDNGDSVPLDMDSITIGDWIASWECGVLVGKVVAVGFLGLAHMPCFLVETAHGRLEPIARDDTRILGLADNPANGRAA